MSYEFRITLPSGRELVLTAEVPTDLDAGDHRFLDALDRQEFSALRVRHAGHAAWKAESGRPKPPPEPLTVPEFWAQHMPPKP